MTDAVVGALVQHVITTILNDGQGVLDFHSQLKDLEQHLDFMQSFLTDVDYLKNNYNTIKTTLIGLRELIYDADDILTDCKIRLEHRKDAPSYYRFSPRKKFFQFSTARKLKKLNLQIRDMRENVKTYLSPQIRPRENNQRVVRWTSQDCNQYEIIGLKEDTEKIKSWIFEKNGEINRVGIVGMAGLGKTTLSQKIFNDSEVIHHFDKLIWISISQTCNERDILRNLLKRVDGDDNGLDESGTMHKINLALSDKMYLIVFDDVWLSSLKDGWWDRLSLPKGVEGGNSIIITTRNVQVARKMRVEETQTHWLKGLNPDDSWSLFCNVTFPIIRDVCKDPELEEVAKEIVKKCGKLPLAIKTVGGLLSAKNNISLSELKRIRDHFHAELSEIAREESAEVIASLQLSYDELPPHLKSCLLCFSVYPEDCEINAEQLVRWWIGEGFIHSKESTTAIELAFDCLSNLISRCLVEAVSRRDYDGRVYSCKVHDMVRDLTIRIAKDETFGSFDDSGRQEPGPNTRHLSVVTWESKMKPLALGGNSKLRAFLLMTDCPFDFDNSGLAAVNSLRVLDLSYNKLDNICIDVLLAWISSQKRLTYLNLRGVANLKKLPKSFKNLWNLHILVLTECNDLEKLSEVITTLKKLTILDIGNCPSLQYFPRGLAKLSNLEFLSGFKLGSPSKNNRQACRLGDLTDLNKLRVLRIEISEKDEIAEEELEVLSKLEQLQVLSINANKCEKPEIIQKLDLLSPPRHLQELYLKNYHGETTPQWINPTILCELQYLHIDSGKLKNMSKSFWNNEVKWKIKGLCFKHLPILELEWGILEKEMPLLKYLEVSHCFKFESFPCDPKHPGFWRKGGKEISEKNDECEEEISEKNDECEEEISKKKMTSVIESSLETSI